VRARSLVLGGAVLLAATTAAAQLPPSPGAVGSIEIGAGAGRFWGGDFAAGTTAYFDQKVKADDDILKGVWAGAQVSTDWNVEIAVRRTATHFLQPSGGVFPTQQILGGFDFATIELAGLRTFRFGNLLPYVGLSAGIANLDPDIAGNPAVHDSTRACLAAIAGAKFYLVNWAGVRVDVRGRATYLGVPRSGSASFFGSGRWFLNTDFLAGAFFSFGGH
jgi:hypothetical protein